MENAPLNLAHFNERRADKYTKRHKYDEAITYLEKSMFYISEAYKSTQIPGSAKVLDAQNWDYRRKIAQLKLQKIYEGTHLIDDAHISEENISYKIIPEMKISIEKTLEDIDIKYKFNVKSKNRTIDNQNPLTSNKDKKDCLGEIESNDFPCLAPLELPTFEFDAFNRKSSDVIKASSYSKPQDK